MHKYVLLNKKARNNIIWRSTRWNKFQTRVLIRSLESEENLLPELNREIANVLRDHYSIRGEVK